MVGSDGIVQSGIIGWYGSLYYFDPTTYLLKTSGYVVSNGVAYIAGSDGKLTAVTNAVNSYILKNYLGHAAIT